MKAMLSAVFMLMETGTSNMKIMMNGALTIGTRDGATIGHALDLIFSDYFSRNEPGVFDPIRDALLTHGDLYASGRSEIVQRGAFEIGQAPC